MNVCLHDFCTDLALSRDRVADLCRLRRVSEFSATCMNCKQRTSSPLKGDITHFQEPTFSPSSFIFWSSCSTSLTAVVKIVPFLSPVDTGARTPRCLMKSRHSHLFNPRQKLLQHLSTLQLPRVQILPHIIPNTNSRRCGSQRSDIDLQLQMRREEES